MNYLDRLIYDRTNADVNYAKANPSSTSFLKGAYNYTDLIRIEKWCRYLADTLNEYGYGISIATKTDWKMDDMPTQVELERIRSNVDQIKTKYHGTTTTPANLNSMTYKKANDIEKILAEIYYMMYGMENWYVYSGVSHAGQPRLWQSRFRHFVDDFTLGQIWLDLTQEYWTDFDINDTWEVAR